MAQHWIVTALGKDRPGIVAGVTEVLYKLGCNLEDSTMTRLGGEFTIMLMFASPRPLTEAKLRERFMRVQRRLKLAIHLTALGQRKQAQPSRSGASYVISVYGADRPGIVFNVSRFLARCGANITDVESHHSAHGAARSKTSLYLLLLEVELPAPCSAAWLKAQLTRLAKRIGVEISVRSAEADVL